MLPELLEEIPLAFRRNMWFQHDGTAAHLARRSGNISLPLIMIAGLDRVGLRLSLQGCWTSHLRLGYIKKLLSYSLPVDSEDYIAHIIHTSATIRQKPGNVEHT
jgi:hypothetical protein